MRTERRYEVGCTPAGCVLVLAWLGAVTLIWLGVAGLVGKL